MRVLITGGAGFIGSNLAKFHIAKNDEVLAIDDLSTGSINNISLILKNPLFQFYNADILKWSHLKKYVAWADRVYHMAAIVGVFEVLEKPINVLATNILGTEQLLRTVYESKSTPIIIIASSSSVYGHANKSLFNEKDDLIIKNPTQTLSTYTVSKLAAEELGLTYYRSKKITSIIVRLFNIIGPNQQGRYGSVVPRFVQQACGHQPITVYGDGTQTRSFCDVRDAVVALDLLANESKAIGEIINIGNDKEISINHLAALIRKKAKSHSEIVHRPYREAYGEEFTDITHRCPDINKLLKLTNMKYQWTLEQSIELLISLYKPELVF